MKTEEIIELLKENNLLIEQNINNINIEYLSYNSNDIKNNTLFICKGFNFKEEYLLDTLSKGVVCYMSEVKYSDVLLPYIIVNDIRKAMAIVGKHYYKIDEGKMYKVGVTGTKGKTTTTYFIHNILNEFYQKNTAYVSTIDYYTGKNYDKSHNTTPDSLELLKDLHEMAECNLDHMVMEISSQATKLHRIYGLHFEIGIFLNIGMDHISSFEHDSFEDYLNCKIKFLKQCKKVLIFKQTDKYDYIVNELKDKEIYTFGLTPDCDYYICDISKDFHDTVFLVRHNNIDEQYRLSIPGSFNCINACAAIVASKIMNINYESIYKGLYKTTVPGRMNIYTTGLCPIVVDYAHNKLSIETLILALKSDYPTRNLKIVVGCPGNKAFNRRKEVGELTNQYASYVYLTAEDPDTKDVREICEEIASYIKSNKYEIIEDREQAIIKAINDASKDDIIAIIGKGDETYQLVNHQYLDYKSDLGVVEEQLELINN